jgi:hypothetical protein
MRVTTIDDTRGMDSTIDGSGRRCKARIPMHRIAHVDAILYQADSASDDLKLDGSSPSVFSLR